VEKRAIATERENEWRILNISCEGEPLSRWLAVLNPKKKSNPNVIIGAVRLNLSQNTFEVPRMMMNHTQ
jgi:hypothetical protein